MGDEWENYTTEQKKNACACTSEKQITTFTMAELREAMRVDWDEKKVPESAAKNAANRAACRELALQDR